MDDSSGVIYSKEYIIKIALSKERAYLFIYFLLCFFVREHKIYLNDFLKAFSFVDSVIQVYMFV